MKKADARSQLCKMQSEVAQRLGLRTTCICGAALGEGEVPDEVVEELWRLVTNNNPKTTSDGHVSWEMHRRVVEENVRLGRELQALVGEGE